MRLPALGLAFLLVGVALGAAPPADDTVEAARQAVRTKQFAQAVQLLTQAAHENSADAQYLLGLSLWNGVGTAANRDAARDNLRRAAQSGHAAAAHALAALLATGSPAERSEAALWLERAASAGYSPSIALRTAHGLPMDDGRAAPDLAPTLKVEVARYAARRDDAPLLAAVGAADVAAARDEFGRTLLFDAAQAGAATVTRQLLGAGALADATDEYSGTALMLAVTQPRAEVTQMLLQSGARVDAADRAGRTALFYAAAANRAEQVMLLLRAGAAIDHADNQGWNAFDLGQQRDSAAALDVLRIAGAHATHSTVAASRGPASIDATRTGALYQGWPPLLIAVARDDAAGVRQRLATDAALDAVTPQGESVLQVAVETRAREVMPLLLGRGADPRRKDRDGSNALERVVRFGDVTTFEILTGAGVTLSNGAESAQLLALAVSANDPAMTRALLAHGASAATADAAGIYPLMRAARLGNAELVKLLLDRGAAAAPLDARGRSALWYAAVSMSVPTVDVLLAMQLRAEQPDRDGTTPLLAAIRSGSDAVVARLLAAATAADAPAAGHQPPLRMAAELGQATVVSMLLARKAEVDASDGFGDTALMAAARNGNAEICLRLLSAGANPRLRNRDHATAAELAEARGFTGLAQRLRG